MSGFEERQQFMAAYPKIDDTSFGRITIDNKTYEHDVYILADKRVKKRKKSLAKEVYGSSHPIGPNELKKICKDKPQVLFIGTGQSGVATLTGEGQIYLQKHDIEYVVKSTPDIIEPYNECSRSKAALIHVTC